MECSCRVEVVLPEHLSMCRAVPGGASVKHVHRMLKSTWSTMYVLYGTIKDARNINIDASM